MCTVVVLFQLHATYPLVIAANRDERYARPSSGPARLAEPAAAVAGRDAQFGGTWFGVNASGVAVAITDQGQTGVDPSKRSRGLLVLDALACASVDAVGALLDGLDGAQYSPFSLLHADAAQAWIGYHADGGVRRERLAPGMHVQVSSLGSDHAAARTARVARLLDPRRLAALPADALVAASPTRCAIMPRTRRSTTRSAATTASTARSPRSWRSSAPPARRASSTARWGHPAGPPTKTTRRCSR